MDENYLDNLLNEFSLDTEIDNHRIEEELDNQMQEEKHKKQEEQSLSEDAIFDMDLNQDANMVTDHQDLHFSEEQMDELDKLDNLADLDIGDLDFDDIDFDDVDITKLDDISTNDLDEVLKEFDGNLEIDDYFKEESHDENNSQQLQEANISNVNNEFEQLEEDVPVNGYKQEEKVADLDPVSAMEENSFNTDDFLDSLLDETEDVKDSPIVELTDDKDGKVDIEENHTDENQSFSEELIPVEEDLSQKDNEDLDELFSMLNLDEDQEKDNKDNLSKENEVEEVQESLNDIEELDNVSILESNTPKKKRSFMQILFGDPDEDDEISEEELAEMEAKKAEKKAKKKAQKEAKKAKADQQKEAKALKNGQKKKENEQKKKLKAEGKAKRRAEEIATMEPEKKLNIPMVIFIFSLFLGGTFLFYLTSNNFNYTQVIEKATNYFANQKYRKAYDEIIGIEVKEKDQDLKDRIYTVMYVERLYESYQNNIELNRQEKALDSLLRGVNKYYEHQEEAKELGITSDLDFSFNQIKLALNDQYGITVEKAIEINKMENYDYVEMINHYISEKGTNSEKSDPTEQKKQDAKLPEENKTEE